MFVALSLSYMAAYFLKAVSKEYLLSWSFCIWMGRTTRIQANINLLNMARSVCDVCHSKLDQEPPGQVWWWWKSTRLAGSSLVFCVLLHVVHCEKVQRVVLVFLLNCCRFFLCSRIFCCCWFWFFRRMTFYDSQSKYNLWLSQWKCISKPVWLKR